jgi:hypothetical protein
MQKCEECADGKFMLDSRNPGLECQPCPPQGVCPNKGTPVFNVSPLKSTISLEGSLDEVQLNAIRRSIAASLGVEFEMVECNGFDQMRRRQAGRRAPVSMTFTVYVDSDKQQQISDLIGSEEFSNLLRGQLDTNGITASVASVGKVQVNLNQQTAVGTVALVDGMYRVVNCPQGYLLVNDTAPGHCFTCERGTYSISPFEGCAETCSVRVCNECPEGAECSGGQDPVVANHFQPKHGTWMVEPSPVLTGGEMLRYRLTGCPEGYKLIRRQANSYTRDKCEMCEFGKLALGHAVYDPVHAEAGRLDTCIECKELVGVECLGGMEISPMEGFWIDPRLVLPDFSGTSMFDPYFDQRNLKNLTRTTIRVGDSVFSFFPEEDGNRSALLQFGTVIEWDGWDRSARVRFLSQDEPRGILSTWIQHRAPRAFQCAPGACLANWTCSPGHFGRLCGLCNESHVMSAEGCTPCDVTQDDLWKVSIVCVVVSLLLWYVTSWRPWLRCTDPLEIWMARQFQAVANFSIRMLVLILNKMERREGREQAIRGRIKILLRLDETVGYAKLIVGYYQVTAGFLTNFGIDWPDMMTVVMSAMSFLSFDFFNLPGVACIFKHMKYEEKLQISTTVPFVVILMLATPTFLIKVLKNRRVISLMGKDLSPDKSVADDTTDACFFSMLTFLFLIYPSVSSTVLNTFNCIDLGEYGSYLTVDLRVKCPRDTLKTGFTWSLVLVFVYPLGIPLFFAFMQWYFQVPKMAKQKSEFYSFKALIAEIGSKLPGDQDLKAILEHWEWAFSPVCLLDRDQCLTLLNHSFASLEVSAEAGGIALLGGKAMNIVSETIDNNAALLSNTLSLAAVATGGGAVDRPTQLPAPELLQVRQMSPKNDNL